MNRYDMPIPPITDPMGRHWRQPDLTKLDVMGTYALLSRAEFEGLLEYSGTRPSGIYPGKCWRRQEYHHNGLTLIPTGRWFLEWFGLVPGNDKVCSNNHLEIIIV